MKAKGLIALITGATSGIGKEIAMRLSAEGAMVLLNYSHSDDRAKAVMDEIVSRGGKAALLKYDVSEDRCVRAMFDTVRSEYAGRLDVLINNAGIGFSSSLETTDAADWDRVLGTNLTGKFLCTKYAVPLLKNSHRPVIVNIASRIGLRPVADASAYCVAESGVLMLTESSALEFSKYRIRVNAVSPGLIDTPLTRAMYSEKYLAEYATRNPLGRLCTVYDVAEAVLFLVSECSGFVTGENINVSGGMLLK